MMSKCPRDISDVDPATVSVNVIALLLVVLVLSGLVLH
jgi:hypothetical protein